MTDCHHCLIQRAARIALVLCLTLIARPSSAQEGTQLVAFALAQESAVPEDQAAAFARFQAGLVEIEANRPHQWGSWTRRERAAWLLPEVHETFLTGRYHAANHSLATTLHSGDFNCLTASILFQATAEQLGLPVMAIQTPGHVWCRLWDTTALDIETTSPFLAPPSTLIRPAPQGDSLSTHRLASSHGGSHAVSANVESTVAAETSPHSDSPKVLTPAALVSKIPYNHASAASDRGDYESAVRLLHQAMSLDPGDPAIRNNLAAALNNWALQAADQGDWQRTAQIRSQLEQLAPELSAELPSLEQVDRAILADHQAHREYAAARAHLRKSGELDDSTASRLRDLYFQWIHHALRLGDEVEAKNAYRQAEFDLARFPALRGSLRLEFPNLHVAAGR
ncbi:MAG: transglutaminase family protein [Pirellulaceae bacterium]